MKKLKIAALLALAGTGFLAQRAQAQLTVNGGDIFLGFRATSGTGSTQDYLIDVGQAILSDAPGQTITIGNLSTDLTSVFGSSWFTSGKTKWGAIGADLPSDPSETIYAGHLESSFGTYPVNPGSTYAPDTTGNQTGYVTDINSMENSFSSSDTNTGNVAGKEAAIQNDSDNNSWASEVVAPSFGEYSGFEATITSATSGSNGQAVDLFRIVPSDEGGVSPTYEGRFVIASTGTVTYTAAVPEPSALTALAGGAGLLGLIRRRRTVTA